MNNKYAKDQHVIPADADVRSPYHYVHDGHHYIKSPLTGAWCKTNNTFEKRGKELGKKLTKARKISAKINGIKRSKNRKLIMANAENVLNDPEISMRNIHYMLEAIRENPSLTNQERLQLIKLYQDNHKLWFGEKKELEISGKVEHTHTLQNIMKEIQEMDKEPVEADFSVEKEKTI